MTLGRPPQQKIQQVHPYQAPLLTLPVEILQHISSYLDTSCCASLSLSSRYLCYALGTNHLARCLESAKTSFDKRGIIEGLIERAFPGHWYCAWCTVFHSWDEGTGPTSVKWEGQTSRACDRFNGYLSASTDGGKQDYTILYHHIRLALSAYLHGPHHGIPLSAFTHHSTPRLILWKTPLTGTLNISARISPSTHHFLLHTSYSLTLPSWALTHTSLTSTLFPLLPAILTSHRASSNGHTGLMAALDNLLRRGWMYPSTQTCSGCTTDWAVSSHVLPGNGGVRLTVRSWRDLGRGESGFEKIWRAHGEWREGREAGFKEAVENGRKKGDVRAAFEMGDAQKARIMSRDEFERVRGRSRPWSWRSKSENEEAARKEVEYRIAMARRVAEGLVRLDAVADSVRRGV